MTGAPQLGRQGRLPPEAILLDSPGTSVLIMVIQPDFSDSHHLGMGVQPPQLVEIPVGQRPRLLGMNPHRRIEIGIPLRQRDGRAGGGEAAGRVDHPRHPQGGEAARAARPILVELLRVVMGVRIENTVHIVLHTERAARRDRPFAYRILLPGATPSTNSTLTSPPSSAARIIPWLSTPQSTAGLRLATRITERPFRSSGAYHLAMPEQTVRAWPCRRSG